MSAALSGLKILDFTKFLPGPYCTWLLGDLGAEIIRLENARELAKQAKVFGWDRLTPEARAALRSNDIFARNKRSAVIDLGDPACFEIVAELVRQSDILIEDYRPGVMEKMGYGYPAMAAVNPRLIYCSVTLCGQTGPYSSKPGHDPIALSISGAQSRIGVNPAQPQFAGVPVADLLTGSNAAIGILSAVFARTTTGRGQHVDIAMSDSSMALIASSLSRYPDLSKLPPRGQGRADCGIWETKDGRFLCTTDMEPRYWERFCSALDREDFIPLQLKSERWEEIKATIRAIFLTRDRDDWLAILQDADTQFAAVYEIEEAMADPHNHARGMVVDAALPDGGWVRQIGSPIHLSDTPTIAPVAAGAPGSDTEALLAEIGRGLGEIGRNTNC